MNKKAKEGISWRGSCEESREIKGDGMTYIEKLQSRIKQLQAFIICAKETQEYCEIEIDALQKRIANYATKGRYNK